MVYHFLSRCILVFVLGTLTWLLRNEVKHVDSRLLCSFLDEKARLLVGGGVDAHFVIFTIFKFT
jgi:hypothetical protein